jgi:hypothetical protein
VAAGDVVSGTAFVRRRFAPASGTHAAGLDTQLTVVLLAYPSVVTAQAGLAQVRRSLPLLAASHTWREVEPAGAVGDEAASFRTAETGEMDADRAALICWRQGRVVGVLLRTGMGDGIDDMMVEALADRQAARLRALQTSSPDL